MARILYIGYEPDTVDYSNPALPPGTNADKIRAGNAFALKQFAERGWEADMFYVKPDGTAGADVERQLRAKTYDCVVIGAGVRVLGRLPDFEAIINAAHRGAPQASIAFNTRPDDSAEAAARWLSQG